MPLPKANAPTSDSPLTGPTYSMDRKADSPGGKKKRRSAWVRRWRSPRTRCAPTARPSNRAGAYKDRASEREETSEISRRGLCSTLLYL